LAGCKEDQYLKPAAPPEKTNGPSEDESGWAVDFPAPFEKSHRREM